MNRRDALSKVALLLGGTLTGPTLLAMSRVAEAKSAQSLGDTFALNETHRKIVAEVAEHIIPKTTTPGAKDAGVPAFIEMMLNDCYKKPEHNSFVVGLVELEKKNFLAQNHDAQVAILKQVEADTKELLKAYNIKQVKVGDNVDKERDRKSVV